MVAGVLLAALALTGCAGGGGGGGDSSDTIKIGASLPLSGALGSFGPIIQAGYDELVADVNAAGGIEIDGVQREVELIVVDNKSDPETVSTATRNLILQDEVVGLLGSVTPPQTVPASNVAEQQGVPYVTSLVPLQVWKAGNPDGWNYAWDFFFDEDTMTDLQFLASDLVDTNRKIALFTDNAEDGVTMGQFYEDKAADFGYEIAYHAKFPVGTTDFSSFVADAKASGAEVLIAQMIPPDGIALWKQLKAAQYVPKVAFCEKCGTSLPWVDALGELAEDSAVTDFFQPSDDPTAAKLIEELGQNPDTSVTLISYSAAKVLTDAIARAGSTDPDAINEAIAQTSGLYPSGHEISFGDDNASEIEPTSVQWRGREVVQIYPAVEGIEFRTPVSGLQ